MLALLLAPLALADGGLAFDPGGKLGCSFVAGSPRDWEGLVDAEPFGQGEASARLMGTLKLGPARLEAAWALSATAGGADGTVGIGTSTASAAPELLPLTWSPDTGEALTVRHRVDRLLVSVKLPHVDLALGRQPVGFGTGRFFVPLDLVNPFLPATLDTEYRPGVDALRADVYAGVSGRLTLVGAWAGKPVVGEDAVEFGEKTLYNIVLAAAGQGTLGTTDLLGFAGSVRGEPVFGLGAAGAIGPVGLHGEATLTLPDEADPFVRAVVGADGKPFEKTLVMGELYAQSFGAAEPSGYLEMLSGERVQRGEVWQLGRFYGAAAVSQELTPLLRANLSVLANLEDPSALLSLGGSWSLSDDAELTLGGYLGVGEAPSALSAEDLLDPDAIAASVRSEFGLYPGFAWLQMRAWF